MRKRHPLDICPAWNEPASRGFRQFISDMGEPGLNMTLIRDDAKAPFNPENCHWEPWANQKRGGPPVNPKSLRQQALAAGLLPQTVWRRIKRAGWSKTQALSRAIIRRVVENQQAHARDH